MTPGRGVSFHGMMLRDRASGEDIGRGFRGAAG